MYQTELGIDPLSPQAIWAAVCAVVGGSGAGPLVFSERRAEPWVVVVAGWYRSLETFVRPVCEVVDVVLASHDGIVCLPLTRGWV